MSLLQRVLYIVLALLGLSLLPSYLHAQDVRPLDLGLGSAVYASHVLDFTSTEECIRRPWCQEIELPAALVHNKAGFAAYEFGTASLEVLFQYELTKHGHRKAARLFQSINAGGTLAVVGHNYYLDTHPEQFEQGYDWRGPAEQK